MDTYTESIPKDSNQISIIGWKKINDRVLKGIKESFIIQKQRIEKHFSKLEDFENEIQIKPVEREKFKSIFYECVTSEAIKRARQNSIQKFITNMKERKLVLPRRKIALERVGKVNVFSHYYHPNIAKTMGEITITEYHDLQKIIENYNEKKKERTNTKSQINKKFTMKRNEIERIKRKILLEIRPAIATKIFKLEDELTKLLESIKNKEKGGKENMNEEEYNEMMNEELKSLLNSTQGEQDKKEEIRNELRKKVEEKVAIYKEKETEELTRKIEKAEKILSRMNESMDLIEKGMLPPIRNIQEYEKAYNAYIEAKRNAEEVKKDIGENSAMYQGACQKVEEEKEKFRQQQVKLHEKVSSKYLILESKKEDLVMEKNEILDQYDKYQHRINLKIIEIDPTTKEGRDELNKTIRELPESNSIKKQENKEKKEDKTQEDTIKDSEKTEENKLEEARTIISTNLVPNQAPQAQAIYPTKTMMNEAIRKNENQISPRETVKEADKKADNNKQQKTKENEQEEKREDKREETALAKTSKVSRFIQNMVSKIKNIFKNPIRKTKEADILSYIDEGEKIQEDKASQYRRENSVDMEKLETTNEYKGTQAEELAKLVQAARNENNDLTL